MFSPSVCLCVQVVTLLFVEVSSWILAMSEMLFMCEAWLSVKSSARKSGRSLVKHSTLGDYDYCRMHCYYSEVVTVLLSLALGIPIRMEDITRILTTVKWQSLPQGIWIDMMMLSRTLIMKSTVVLPTLRAVTKVSVMFLSLRAFNTYEISLMLPYLHLFRASKYWQLPGHHCGWHPLPCRIPLPSKPERWLLVLRNRWFQ